MPATSLLQNCKEDERYDIMTSLNSVKNSLLMHIVTPSLKVESTNATHDVEDLHRVSEHFLS